MMNTYCGKCDKTLFLSDFYVRTGGKGISKPFILRTKKNETF